MSKVRGKLHEEFNVELIAQSLASEQTQFMLFGHGYKAGMEAAAELLREKWFKTQADCAHAIVQAAGKL
jgi:hypothetical protein